MTVSEGLYDAVMTRRLSSALASRSDLSAQFELAESADSHVALAKYLQELVRSILHGLPQADRLERQIEICNRVIQLLASEGESISVDDEIELPARVLVAVVRQGLGGESKLIRPTIPLGQSALLVNGPGEPSVGTEVAHELESADSVDLLCAFIKWYGVRTIREQLKRFLDRGGRLRVLTTTYMGATERRAIDDLVGMGAELKISYEVDSTRLHAKAWLFERATRFSTAYIGSSNLSRAAMIDGLEWNVRLSQQDAPDIFAKFRATFETYWNSDSFERWNPTRDAARFDHAIGAQSMRVAEAPLAYFDVHPRPHQQRILDDLEAERTRHNRWRNLVVAATGTGKTVIAALDYKRLRQQFPNVSLLFIAHRREILKQSLHTFRNVLRDGSFGELYVDGQRPDQWRHVFASIQSLATIDLDTLDPTRFDVVIVDEFHHAAASTYQRLLNHVRPRMLLGLTATPERTDGRSVTEWFDGRFASELRLWDALDEGILCPFHYFGVSDDVDLSQLEWKRGGYQPADLDRLYTGNDARVNKVLEAIGKYGDAATMRALGFCVSVEHAKYMAQRFSEAGLPSVAVSANTPTDERELALRKLRDGHLRTVFAVDLFNEGVDVPEIDTVLLLRPTESATVFLQQLGRGLRRVEGKACLTVFDFIGQQHRRFRFDLRYSALTGDTPKELSANIAAGFPFLPGGCHIELDRVAQNTILASVAGSLRVSFRDLARELREAGSASLAEFLALGDVTFEDIYRRGSWTRLRRDAGLEDRPVDQDEDALSDGLSGIAHVDDPERTGKWIEWLSRRNVDVEAMGIRDRRLVTMLHFLIWGAKHREPTLERSIERLWRNGIIREEMVEVLRLLEDRARSVTVPLVEPLNVPLHVHARYTLDEVMSAMGASTAEEPRPLREGVLWNEATASDMFFVTLEKSETRFSPSTRYRDYAISSDLFHWESQNKTSETSSVGQRYVNHKSLGSHVLLFVRERNKDVLGTMPYTFLGPADYVSHEGNRPMAITWRLRHPMPPALLQVARVAAS